MMIRPGPNVAIAIVIGSNRASGRTTSSSTRADRTAATVTAATAAKMYGTSRWRST